MPAYTVKEGAPAIIADQEHDGPGSIIVLSEDDAAEPLAFDQIELHEIHTASMTQ